MRSKDDKRPTVKVVKNPLRVGWAARSGERGGVGTYAVMPAPVAGCYEFFVDSAGTMLMRSQVTEQLVDAAAGCAEYEPHAYASATVVLTGAHKIKEFCRSYMGSAVPEVVEGRLRALESSTNGVQGDAGKVRGMKTENGKSVRQVWEELFVENEGRKEKWTDEQLKAEFKKRVPNSKAKGDPRPSMMRSFYNNGTYSFEALGKAADRKLPTSHRYDESGNVIEPGHREAADKAAEARAARVKDGKASIADIERERRAKAKAKAKGGAKKGGAKKVVKKKLVAKK